MMNRVIKLLSLAILCVVATTSCSTIVEGDDSGTVDLWKVDLTVTVPLSTEQRLDAGYSTQTIKGEYDLRVVIELYSVEISAFPSDRKVLYISESDLTDSSSVSAVFKVDAVENYALVWCDYVEAADESGNYSDLVYNVDDLRRVSIIDNSYDVECNSLRRAFAGKVVMTELYDLAETIKSTAELEVPVKSVVGGYVLTDDTDSVADDYSAQITYTGSVATGFNILTGSRMTSDDVVISYKSQPILSDSKMVVAYDYLLLTDETRALDTEQELCVSLYDDSAQEVDNVDKVVSLTAGGMVSEKLY